MATNDDESSDAQKKSETTREDAIDAKMDRSADHESEDARPRRGTIAMSPAAKEMLEGENRIAEPSVPPSTPPTASPSGMDKANCTAKRGTPARISRRTRVSNAGLSKANPPSGEPRRTMVPAGAMCAGDMPDTSGEPESMTLVEGDAPEKRSSSGNRRREKHRHSKNAKSPDTNRTVARSEIPEEPSPEIMLPGAYNVIDKLDDAASADDADDEYDEEYGERRSTAFRTMPSQDGTNDETVVVNATVPTRKPQIAAEDVKAIKPEPEDRGSRKKRFILMVIVALVLTVVIVAISIVLSRNGGEGEGSNSNSNNDENETPIVSPTPPPFDSARLPALQARLQELNFPFDIPSTSKALEWLANEDGAMLDFANEDATVLAQRYAIAALYFATGGPSWTACNKILSNLTICEWNCKPDELDYGIFCNDDNDVTQLLFDDKNLSGSLPKEMLALTALQVIDMGSNALRGTIGPEITGLTQLEELLLDFNLINGSIPDDISKLTQLRFLTLGANNLNGTIPSAAIGSLTNLVHLAIESNRLAGSLPTQLGLLTNLERLFIHSTRINGTIPSQIEKLTGLLEMHLFGNRLRGTIPSQLGRLSRLTSLYLYENELSGTVPTSIASLANLRDLRLEYNDLIDDLDDAFCSASKEATWLTFSADCPGKVTCSCCTSCLSQG